MGKAGFDVLEHIRRAAYTERESISEVRMRGELSYYLAGRGVCAPAPPNRGMNSVLLILIIRQAGPLRTSLRKPTQTRHVLEPALSHPVTSGPPRAGSKQKGNP